jgi:anthranilate synthase component 1
VVGAPKVRALELIDEREGIDRGAYAGTVGHLGHPSEAHPAGAMDQAITIRTLVFHGGKVRMQAGAGIVADSVPAAEYAEVCAKVAALGAALVLAEEEL